MTLLKPPPAYLSAASSLSRRLVPRFFFLRTPTKCRCCSVTLNGGGDVLNQSQICKRWVTVERNIPPPSHFSFSLAKQHKKRTKTFYSWHASAGNSFHSSVCQWLLERKNYFFCPLLKFCSSRQDLSLNEIAMEMSNAADQ